MTHVDYMDVLIKWKKLVLKEKAGLEQKITGIIKMSYKAEEVVPVVTPGWSILRAWTPPRSELLD